MLLLENARFYGKSTLLEQVLKEKDYELNEEDELLLAAIKESTEAAAAENAKSFQEVSEGVTEEDVRLDEIESTDSHGVLLMAETLKNVISTQTNSSIEKYNKQIFLEEECLKLAIEQDAESFKMIPGLVKGIHSVKGAVANDWLRKFVDELEREVKNDNVLQHIAIPLKSAALIVIAEIMVVPSRRELAAGCLAGDLVVSSLVTRIGQKISNEAVALELNKSKSKKDVCVIII